MENKWKGEYIRGGAKYNTKRDKQNKRYAAEHFYRLFFVLLYDLMSINSFTRYILLGQSVTSQLVS